MSENGPITLRQVTTAVSLIAGLSAVIGGYYVMGYRLEAAEKTADKALTATVEIPVIKRDIEYIKRTLDDQRDLQRQQTSILQDIQSNVRR